MITTKMLIPGRPKDMIRRQRLVDALLAAPQGGIVLVHAPAGFGKTTMLVDFAHCAQQPVSWLSLDDADSDPVALADYLRAAVALGLELPRRRDGHPAEPNDVLGEVLGLLAQRESWLVLDDFHSVGESADNVRLADRLVRLLPPSTRLAITSRTMPNVPSLPRARLHGRIVEITASHLAFTPEEVREYTSQFGSQTARADEVAARTEGWPAAVAFLSRIDWAHDHHLQTDHLFQFLAAEVFAQLSSPVKQFLVSSCVLESLTAEACDFVLEQENSGEILASLDHDNVPVVQVRVNPPTYVLHALFRDFLRAESLREKETYRRLHARAAAWYQGHGEVGLVVRHLAEGEHWDELRRLLVDEAPAAYRAGRWQTIVSWLKLLPDRLMASSPDLLVWRARVLIRLAQTDPALQVIDQALHQLGTEHGELKAELLTLKGNALRVRGEAAEALVICQEATALAIESDAKIGIICEARKQLGLALYAVGSLPEAVHELRSVMDIYEQRGDTTELAFVNACLGSALGSQGKLAESAIHLEQARQQWSAVGNSKEVSWVANNLAVTYFNLGRLPEAQSLLDQSLQRARQAGHERAEAFALLSLADVRLATGDLAAAEESFKAARALADSLADDSISTYCLIGLAEVQRFLGNLTPAEAFIDQAIMNAAGRGATVEEATAKICRGRILRQHGRLADAVETFAGAEGALQQSNAGKERVEALYELAATRLLTRHRRAEVVPLLALVETLTRELGHEVFLARLVHDQPNAAEYAASRRIGGRFFKDILRTGRGLNTEHLRREEGSSSKYPSVKLAAFGQLSISVDDAPLSSVEWESGKGPELLLFLLLASHPVRRGDIVAALWPDSPPARGVSSFHSTVHRLRRALYRECVLTKDGAYLVNPEGDFECDVVEFHRLIQQALLARGTDAIPLLRQATHLYQSGLATGLSSEWSEGLRRQLEVEFIQAANRCAGAAISSGRPDVALELSRRVTEIDPLNEAAWHSLIEASLTGEDSHAAAAYYAQYMKLLQAEGGFSPSSDFLALRRRISSVVSAQGPP